MRNIILLLIVVAALSGFCAAPVESKTTFARDALAPFVERGELPGAINVFYKDGVQETCCIGYADVAAKRPITLDDVFMQCSQTKGMCGVTIAILIEEGKIALDDPVAKYLPEFKTMWIRQSETNGIKTLVQATNELKIRNVMNHTGGFPFDLPNHMAMGGWVRRMPIRSVAAMAATCPLQFEPGTSVQYSNVGIDIGAAIVEVVTGKRWEDFLQERVLDPLGMTASSFKPSDKQLATKIELYVLATNKPPRWVAQPSTMPAPHNDDRVFAAAGAGLWTTANDQLKFYKMLMNLGISDNGARILKEETVKSLLAVSTRPVKWRRDGYSLGLAAPTVKLDSENPSEVWFGHGGAWGTNCMVNWRKKQLKLWVVQIAGQPRPWDAARDEAANKFFNTKIDNSGVDAYTGRTD